MEERALRRTRLDSWQKVGQMNEDNPFRVLLLAAESGESELVLKRIASFFKPGFAFLHVANIEGAVAHLREQTCNILLLDLDLPGSSALEILQCVKATSDQSIVIALSADSSLAMKRMIAEEGITDFISKDRPFADQLTRSVLFWFERHWIRHEHEQLERIISANPDAVVVTDDSGTVLFTNDAALDLFGAQEEDLIGESMSFAVREGTISEIEILHRGESRTAETRVVDFTWQGKPAYLASIRDITERKRAEEAIRRQAEELARSNEDLQQFAYVASHDLQEPLRTVTSFAQLLEQRYKGQLDEQGERWIEHIVDGSNRMQTLIKDLLAYSRVSTHGQEFSLCDTNTVLRIALKNLGGAIETSGAEIAYGSLPKLPGDQNQLVSLFQNLLGNAIKYRGEQPLRIDIDVHQKNSEWLFSVQDNGIGIDAQFAERIFIIFQRLHSRKKYAGTGIGLALCKRIVDRHGGRIWVESELGQGATFFFTLPATNR